jgi:hypothetical protein
MRTMKKKIAVVLMIMVAAVVSLTAISYAAEWQGPAAALAELTGKTEEEIQEARTSGNGYGVQAAEADVLDEFISARQQIQTERLAEAVDQGVLTQEEADARVAQIEERRAACEGDSEACQQAMGENGLRLKLNQDGSGSQNGQGTGKGAGQMGQGMRRGGGNGTGVCLAE